MQYLKHVRPFRDIPIFERFPVLICVSIVWIYSLILTASGAYRDKPNRTQISCRTDRVNLISTAPWYVEEEIYTLKFFCVLPYCEILHVMYSRFKFPYPLQWGPPTFSAGHSFAMMSAVLVSMVEVYPIFVLYYCPTRMSLIINPCTRLWSQIGVPCDVCVSVSRMCVFSIMPQLISPYIFCCSQLVRTRRHLGWQLPLLRLLMC